MRDDGLGDDDEIALPVRSNRRAAAMGGALGLCAVLAIFGAARFVGRGHPAAITPPDAHAAVAALLAAEPVAAAPGTPTGNVPLFGADAPLDHRARPRRGARARPRSPPPPPPAAPAPGDGDEEPAPGDSGRILKEWGQGSVSHPDRPKDKD